MEADGGCTAGDDGAQSREADSRSHQLQDSRAGRFGNFQPHQAALIAAAPEGDQQPFGSHFKD